MNTPQTEFTSIYQKFSHKLSGVATKPRTRTYSMLIFSLVALILLGQFAIRPTIKKILQLRREIKDKTIINRRMDEKIAGLISAQADYNSLRAKLTFLGQAIPGEPFVTKYIANLKQLESSNGVVPASMFFADVSLTAVSASQAAALEPVAAPESSAVNASAANPLLDLFTVSAKITGNYETIRAYLNALANMRRITTVSSLTIKRGSQAVSSDTSSSSLPLDVSLQLDTYYLKTE